MGGEQHTASTAGWRAGVPRPGRIHIVRVDYAKNELYDADGNGYFEMPGGMWAPFGPVHEGSVRYWGSGSHAGHINLMPVAQYRNGTWVNVM